VKLREYQEQAADFLYARDRALILAPVGAGKTAMTLVAMEAMLRDGHVSRFLVLAPKRVCVTVWPAEAPKWAPALKVAVAVGTPKQRLEALKSRAQVVVTNYDNLQWLAKQAFSFDAVAFDELTRLKNPSGERFKALHKLLKDVHIRWGLTGSFTSNGLEDVFGQCKIVDESLLGRSKGAFLQQYFYLENKEFNQWEPRPESLPLVMQKIKPATFVLEPGEYRDKLPPLHTVEMRCEMANRAPYDQMKKDFVAQFPTAEAVAVNAGVVTQKLTQMSSGFVYDTQRTAADTPGTFHVKQTAVWFDTSKFDLLDEVLQENQRAPTLVWYAFQEELAELRRRYPHAQTLDTPDAVNRWNAGKIELLLAHPQSAGHGVNLQGQNKMVFLSLPWSLELYEQAVGRLHRGGQTQPVWVYILLTNKTIDEKIWAALHDKRELSHIAMEELKCPLGTN
jgi:SNF2 family DNA or RNA helicase